MAKAKNTYSQRVGKRNRTILIAIVVIVVVTQVASICSSL